MNILILGSGGREHAIAWKIAQSPKCNLLHIAPGNAGTDHIAKNVPLDILDFGQIEHHIRLHDIHMVIVGPEAPLVAGIKNYLNTNLPQVIIVGPDEEGAQLEGSKAFSKIFMKEYGIPTAKYREVTIDNIDEGYTHIENSKTPIVLKADGLAAGKGVLILHDRDEAKRELDQMLNGKFGKASQKVVIEEFLKGIEFSVFVYVSDAGYVILPEAKDYKRIGEGDTGLNTGGMGAVSPVPFVDEELMTKVKERIIDPTLSGLKKRGIKYRGFIFLGLIKVDNDPYVIEYNVRMGDPETEVVIPRIKSDLVDVLLGLHHQDTLKVDDRSAATVMVVSEGYPASYEKGKKIDISSADDQNSILFHAGTKKVEADILTNGGRVLTITSLSENHKKAIEMSMQRIITVNFDGMYYRKDIGFDL